MAQTITVTGMSCDGCEQAVEDALQDLDGVTLARADHESESVEINTEGSGNNENIRAVIDDAGYEVAE